MQLHTEMAYLGNDPTSTPVHHWSGNINSSLFNICRQIYYKIDFHVILAVSKLRPK